MTERRDLIQTRSRTYDTIRDDILRTLPILAPGWTSHGRDEPGMAILDILTGVSDGLHHNLDKQAREMFFRTAQLESSVHDLAQHLNYRPKRWVAAQGELIVNIITGDESDVLGASLPALSALTTGTGQTIVTLETLSIPDGFSGQLSTPVLEGVYRTFETALTPENNRTLLLPDERIAEQLFTVFVNNELWFDATEHPLDADIDNFYYVRKTADDRYEIAFRPSRGRVPPYGAQVTVTYLQTDAVNLEAGTVQPPTTVALSGEVTWSHTDLARAAQPETAQEIKDRAPANHSTRGRAVSEPDYLELGEQIPGVKSVRVRKNPRGWNTVEVFVATRDGDPPSVNLLETVRTYFATRNNMVTTVRTYPAVFRRFVLEVSVHPFESAATNRVMNDVRAALREALSYNKLNFSSPIRISDLYGILEKIPGVDYSNIQALHWLDTSRGVRNLTTNAVEHPVMHDLKVTTE